MLLQINKNTIYHFIRFGLVGVFNTVLDLVVLNLLISVFGVVDPLAFSVCKGISFIIALLNSYFMNKYFTFAKKQKSQKEFYLFFIVSIIGLFINIGISSFLFYLISLSSYNISVHIIATVSGIIGAMFSMVINYISYSYFVFK